jgi:DNA-binding transcriptional ArsR family regulator
MVAGIQIEFDEVEANFTIVPNQVLYNRQLTSDARLLWVYLRSHKIGYLLGYRQIEADLGWSETTVRKHLKALTEAGFVKLHQSRDGARNGKLKISLLLGNKPILQTVDSEGSKSEGSKSEGLNKTKELNKTIEATISAQNEFERSKSSEDFGKFWAVYPKKAGKLKAQKAFAKAAKLVAVDVLVRAAEGYARDPNRSVSFTKDPTTWLNGGCWDDEALAPRVVTYVEQKDLQAVASRRQTDSSKQQAREAIAAVRKAAETASAPTQCEHGISLVRCLVCAKKLSLN